MNNVLELNSVVLGDCMDIMPLMAEKSVDLTLTDIPYNGVNRKSNGLRSLDKGKADVLTFDLKDFLEEVYRVTSSTIIIFCGQTQVSEIISFFNEKKKKSISALYTLPKVRRHSSIESELVVKT